MNRSRTQATSLSVLIFLFAPSVLFGQTEKGAIAGAVSDSQGGVIPGASVTITNLGTNVSQAYTTNAEGLYEAPFLTPGLYKVSAASRGFSTSVNNNVTVNVGRRVRVNLVLQIGSVASQVEVTDSAPLVQTESASIGQVIDNKTLTELPNVDRNIYKLLVLSSNVAQGLAGNAEFFRVETGGTVTISGTRPSSVTYKIDGLSNTDPTFGTPTVTPSVDSVKEFSHQPFREQLLGGARIDPRDGGRLVVADPEVARLTNSPLVVCCTGPRVVETDRNDFGPRIGVAIRPFEKDNLVVRAGYGVFYSDMSQFFHWLQWQPLQGRLFDPAASNFLTPTATLDDPFPSSRFTPSGSRVAVGIPSGVSAAALGNRPMVFSGGLGSYRTPYSQQWSLSLQREVYRFDQINNVRARDGLTDPNRGSIPEYVFLFNPRVIQVALKFVF